MSLSEQEKVKAEREFNFVTADAHETCIRQTYHLFGLRNEPKTIRVAGGSVSSFCRHEKTNEPYIKINKYWGDPARAFELAKESGFDAWKEWLSTRAYDAAHETGHFLHSCAAPVQAEVLGWKDWQENQYGTRKGKLLSETIAELTAIAYAEKRGIFSRVSFYASADPFFWPAWFLRKEKGIEILTRLVRADISEALEIIRPHAKEVNNLCRLPGYFEGVYIGEEAA